MFKSVKQRLTFALVIVMVATMAFAGLAVAQSEAPLDLPGAGWWTGIQLQNVGTGEASVQVQSYRSASAEAPVTTNATIAQSASTTLLPQNLQLADGFQGSAVVSSNQALNAIVNITNREAAGNGVAGGKAAAQYQGVNTPATSIRFPLAKQDWFGKWTTFNIQNAGNSAATATAVFIMNTGTFSFTTPSIEPGRMVIVTPQQAGAPANSLGSLTVTSAQPLAGVVTEHGNENPGTLLQATRGFTAQDGDTTAYAPIIKSGWFNRFTGLQVQNVSNGAIDITVTYNGAGGACAGQSLSSTQNGVAAGASFTFVHIPGQGGNPLPDNCLAAATITATGDVVAIVNESFLPAFITGGGNGGRQESTTYSAFPASAATTTVNAPLYKENSFSKATGLQVQNVGSANASVTATFVGSGGTYTTQAQTIAPGGAFTFVDLRTKASLFSGTPIPSDISGSAGVFGVTVTSNQPIVAIANESTYPFNASPLEQDKNNYEAFNQ